MTEKITDVDGIGPKTAEKLQRSGITNKQELLQAYKNNNTKVTGSPVNDGLNKRALDGVRRELTERGETFIDPVYGVPASPENQQARDAFDLELGRDVAEGFGEFTRDKGGVDAGMNVLEAAGEAITGDLGATLNPESYEEITPETSYGRQKPLDEADTGDKARKEAFEFGLDAAANLTPIGRDTLKKGNELSKQAAGMGDLTVKQTTTEQRQVASGTIDAEKNMQIDSREYARARNFQRQRSPKARRVDNRREAPVTDEITTWKENPSHWDYPGIDTPGGRQDIVTEEQRNQAAELDSVFDNADPEVTEVAFGDPLDDMSDLMDEQPFDEIDGGGLF